MNVIDMHCDTLLGVRYDKKHANGGNLRSSEHHLDLMKMKEGNYLLQCFAVFVNLERAKEPLVKAMELIDLYYEQIKENEDLIAPVFSYEDIERNMNQGKMSALLSGEEGQICLGNVSVLRNLYRLGMRMMTLTWNHENDLAYPNQIEIGLKDKGFEIISEMEKLHMIIDVSHLSDKGFYDVLSHTSKPFVASHSNARAVCGHPRNLTDEMLKAMGERGCVTGLNYCSEFLSDANLSTTETMVAQVKHITNVAGTDIMALGSDFDGIQGSQDLKNASYVPKLYDGLKNAGFSSEDVDKFFYKNALRVFKECL